MTQSFWQYLKGAFNARPMGMWVPPNWVGVGCFAALGFLNEGFWILGTGLELAYLVWLTSNARFRKVIDAQANYQVAEGSKEKVAKLVGKLSADDQQAYKRLEARCQKILQNSSTDAAASSTHSNGLGLLLWIYLRLLKTRRDIELSFTESEMTDRDADGIKRRVADIQKQLAAPGITDELKKSLEGQLEILGQRQERRKEAEQKLAFIESELTRIVEQVELIREQALVTPAAEALSERIDSVGATLAGTTKWIQDQQAVLGQVDEVLDQPPPLTL